MDFQIVTFDPTTGVATLGIPPVPQKLRGINYLVQVVVIEILKNGGQDTINPTDGSGLRGLIGQFNYANPQEIRVQVTQNVAKAQTNIIQNQLTSNAPAVEKLLSLKVLNIVVDSVNSNTVLSLQVNNEAGQSAEVNV